MVCVLGSRWEVEASTRTLGQHHRSARYRPERGGRHFGELCARSQTQDPSEGTPERASRQPEAVLNAFSFGPLLHALWNAFPRYVWLCCRSQYCNITKILFYRTTRERERERGRGRERWCGKYYRCARSFSIILHYIFWTLFFSFFNFLFPCSLLRPANKIKKSQ